MSLTSQVGTAAGVLAAAGAAVSLWLGAERYAGPPRRAYRWFAVAAALWGAGVIASHVLAVPVEAAAIPLSSGDLPSLLALPAMAAGFARLAAAGSQEAAEAHPPAGVRAQSNALTRLADGYILASALFLIAWVTLFRIVFLLVGAAGLALLAWARWAGGAGAGERAGQAGQADTRWRDRLARGSQELARGSQELARGSQDAGTAARPSPAVPGVATAAAAAAAG